MYLKINSNKKLTFRILICKSNSRNSQSEKSISLKPRWAYSGLNFSPLNITFDSGKLNMKLFMDRQSFATIGHSSLVNILICDSLSV